MLSKKLLRLILLRNIIQKKQKRRYWVHPLNENRQRDGEHKKIDKMYRDHPNKFFEYTRMNPQLFDKLLAMVEPYIKKENLKFRNCIPARIRLYVTLRFEPKYI